VKRCPQCGEVKPENAFHRWSRRDGRQVYCKACRKAYDAAYWQRTKHLHHRKASRNDAFRRWYEELKSRPCADCGGTYPPPVMHWDHLPGHEKIEDVGRIAQRHNRTAVSVRDREV
jgi:hypothetical protein